MKRRKKPEEFCQNPIKTCIRENSDSLDSRTQKGNFKKKDQLLKTGERFSGMNRESAGD